MIRLVGNIVNIERDLSRNVIVSAEVEHPCGYPVVVQKTADVEDDAVSDDLSLVGFLNARIKTASIIIPARPTAGYLCVDTSAPSHIHDPVTIHFAISTIETNTIVPTGPVRLFQKAIVTTVDLFDAHILDDTAFIHLHEDLLVSMDPTVKIRSLVMRELEGSGMLGAVA